MILVLLNSKSQKERSPDECLLFKSWRRARQERVFLGVTSEDSREPLHSSIPKQRISGEADDDQGKSAGQTTRGGGRLFWPRIRGMNTIYPSLLVSPRYRQQIVLPNQFAPCISRSTRQRKTQRGKSDTIPYHTIPRHAHATSYHLSHRTTTPKPLHHSGNFIIILGKGERGRRKGCQQ